MAAEILVAFSEDTRRSSCISGIASGARALAAASGTR